MQDNSRVRSRLAQALLAAAALIAMGNGLVMLIDPLGWYEMAGTVKATGPANGHFIRDIGLAYLLCAGLLVYAAFKPAARWRAALCGAGWLALHGGLHIYEVLRGICSPDIFWREAPGTLGPPLLALAGVMLVLADRRTLTAAMPPGILLQLVDKATGGMSPHLQDIGAAPGGLAGKYRDSMPVWSHRHEASAEMFHHAQIAAELAEDCRPCALIAAKMALGGGIPREEINAALTGKPPPGPGAQAFQFARAVSLGLPEANSLGDAIEAEHGRGVRTELAVAVAMARTHPAIKRGLGYSKSCASVPLAI